MELIDTIDNGESEVQITTIGKVVGSDVDGNPIEQNFSEEALKSIAEKSKDKEFLVDADHESETGGSTEAKGWISNIEFKEGKGLFGKIKWTCIGRHLVENRIFRWLSPTWLLNKLNEPEELTSVALTNKPSQAGRIDPIINSEPDKEISKENIDMTKEEILEIVKQEVATAVEAAMNACKNEEPEKVEKEEKVEEKTEEVKNNESEKLSETSSETTPVVEVKKEITEEIKKEPEVIKEEVLNSAPILGKSVQPEWQNLHGKEFISWCNKHQDYIKNYK